MGMSAIPSSFLLEGCVFHVGPGSAMCFGYEQLDKLIIQYRGEVTELRDRK